MTGNFNTKVMGTFEYSIKTDKIAFMFEFGKYGANKSKSPFLILNSALGN